MLSASESYEATSTWTRIGKQRKDLIDDAVNRTGGGQPRTKGNDEQAICSIWYLRWTASSVRWTFHVLYRPHLLMNLAPV
jgi:hypothetical protein